MTTVATPAVAALLAAAARTDNFFTEQQLRDVIAEHLPHTNARVALLSVLQIAHANSNAGRYELENKHALAERWRELALTCATNAIEADQLYAIRYHDTSSSASRQHYIDTGRYLALGEAEAV